MTSSAITINLDLSPLNDALGKIKNNVTGQHLTKPVMAGLLMIEAFAKLNIMSTFKQHTGFLASAWDTALDQIGEKSASGHIAPLAVYARIQELGGTIHATNAPALVFQTEDGNWHRVQAVTLPARPYLRPAVDSNLAEITAAVSLELRKLIELFNG